MSADVDSGQPPASSEDQIDDWTAPTEAILETIAQSQGLASTPERMRLILSHYKALWPSLTRLRGVQLDYIDPIQPSDVFDWIERWPMGKKSEAGDVER